MDNLAVHTSEEHGHRARNKKRDHRRWIFSGYVRKGVRYTLALCLAVFTLYIIGNMPDPGFPDRLLFFLLTILLLFSLLLCAFSLFAMGFSVHRLVYYPSVRNTFALVFYFFTGLLGAGLIMFNSLVVVASGGNI